MTWLYAAQLIVPLVLIGWLLWRPTRNAWGFIVQVFGSAAALAVLTLQGVWLMPPWWTPFVFAIALMVVAWTGWRRVSPFPSKSPRTWGAWAVLVFFIGLAGIGTYGTVTALQSRKNKVAGVVNLVFPLQAGRYLVANGGSNQSTNAHLETLDASVPRYRAWRGQSYGVDIVAVDRFGLRASGVQPADPHAYRIFGASVFAPCVGRVVTAVDGLPDMQVPEADREHLAGNHVMLRCAEVDVLLGHFQQGSVRVHAGDHLKVGDWIGSVGNSGNTSEPHLHIHAQSPGPTGAPLGGDPRPIEFNSRFLVRGDTIVVP